MKKLLVVMCIAMSACSQACPDSIAACERGCVPVGMASYSPADGCRCNAPSDAGPRS